MKYGKTYEDLLAQKNFDKWRESSLRYKTLKKVITKLTKELAEIGLDAAVLRELLHNEPDQTGPLQTHHDIPKRMDGRKARAVYQLHGTPDSPAPRIKLVFESSSSQSDSEGDHPGRPDLHSNLPPHKPSQAPSSSSSDHVNRFEELSDNDVSVNDLGCSALEHHPLLGKLYGQGLIPASQVTPPGSPVLERYSVSPTTPKAHRNPALEQLQLPDAALAPDMIDEEGSSALDDGDAADDETLTGDNVVLPRKKKKRRPSRVVYVPLASDQEFYTLLAKALHSIKDLEEQQKVQFAAQVQRLVKVISRAASPAKSQADMYAWREVFSLWVEAQIFESSRERDRGERSLEEAEQRLEWFADQVGRRKLAQKMKQKESQATVEEFLDLNMTLLDLKRFIRMNEEATRKIIKKHDKRTALTAAVEFPQFLKDLPPAYGGAIASTKLDLSLPDSVTLPHVLLATMTEMLLPIIPQIDDYICVICGDIGYKPIRLECGHHFCLRCLVKMQMRKQDACPHCRASVVLKADAHNLDNALEQFLELYFPREVKAKARSNEKEVTLERWQGNTGEAVNGKLKERCTVA